ncbi:hypothetical protein KFE96_08505 [Kordiimonas sp. SCSIO 12603]|uniref:S41 family peptidase n=1 Tax=Kordiimonas sp. SCSIO 12603 TaxID=2829596 RepID=UPI002107AEBA|nr:S41 family peptidase [Kordiimonas sp. SCSIO 12603]UTW60341.1 hypothetical protein KFE96_08505 [Kordiimonas sp. SCSIO 12603]
MKTTLIASSAMLFSICATAAPVSSTAHTSSQQTEVQTKRLPEGELVSVEALREDLAKLKDLLETTHPDPSFTMDVEQVKFQIDRLSEGLKKPLSHYEAWQYLAQLNPYFQDGHMAVFFPEAGKYLQNHIESGGRLFPFKVQIDTANRIYIADTQGTIEGFKAGDEITRINGLKSAEIIKAISSRMHGDSPSHRLALASDRFSQMYWMLYGDSGYYKIETKKNGQPHTHTVIGSDKNPRAVDPELEELVQRERLDNDIGYLRIDRFYYKPAHEEAFFNFMKATWQEFHDKGVKDVIIDVRKNPGGTDHYWHLGIAPYVASEPFSFVSKFKVRLTERNLRLGPVKGELGSIVEAPFDYMIPVDGQEELKIPGQAYLLMGPLSYSSSILFLTAFQDSKQAVIAGPSSGVRSCTTGRIQPLILSGSKLEVTLPTAIFTRSSGDALCQQPMTPDLIISSNPINPEAEIADLAEKIIAGRTAN